MAGSDFIIAYRYMLKSARFHESKDDPETIIFSVANAFEDCNKDFQALRAIGTKLWHASDNDGGNGTDKVQDAAIEYLRKSLDMTRDSDFQKGATCMILWKFYSTKKERQRAIDTLDCALEAFIKVSVETGSVTQKQLDDVYDRGYLLLVKANIYSDMDKKDVALQVYNEARRAAGDETIYGYWLNNLTELFDEKFDPDGHRLMEVLKSWSEKERRLWFESCLCYYPEMSSLERIYRAAKLSGETELILDWLTAFEKSLSPRSLTSLNLKAAQATFYLKVVGNVEKAKEALQSALASQPKLDGSEDYILQLRISVLRMDLANLIFSQFRASSDPDRKDTLLSELKTLPGMKSDDVSLKETNSFFSLKVINTLTRQS
jgi:tetratricopeptide (TPR) repeat protein